MIGFNPTNIDPNILVFKKENWLIIVRLYIDNFMLAINLEKAIEQIKRQLFDEFNIKDLGKVKVIIGWEIIRDLQTKILKIDQNAYI